MLISILKHYYKVNIITNSTKRLYLMSHISFKNLIISYKDLKNNLELELQETKTSPNEFYQKEPIGVYTGCRTVKHKGILEYKAHLSRLIYSINKDVKCLEDKLIEERVEYITKVGLLSYYHYLDTNKMELKYKDGNTNFPENEVKLSYFLTIQNHQPILKVHLSPLLIPKVESCKVELIDLYRDDPTVKATQWVNQRDYAEKTKSPLINELLMVDEKSGQISEGLASNLFVIKEENNQTKLITCPLDKVLKGTIQMLTIEIANKLNIEIQFESPNLNKFINNEYKGAFLTSTSRLLLPIDTIYIKKDSLLNYQQQYNTKQISMSIDHPILIKLRKEILNKIEERTKIII